MPSMLDYQLTAVCLVTAVYFLTLSVFTGSTRKLRHIPTAGFTMPILFLFSSVRYFLDARSVIEESIAKWPTSIFKIPYLLEWLVIIHQPSHIEDLRKMPEHILSSLKAFEYVFQLAYTLGHHINENPYHVPIIRTQLTRSLPLLVPEIHDELVQAFKHYIPLTDDWSEIKALDTAMKIISRTSNRAFVGAPLCRNPEWIEVNVQYTLDVIKVASIPRFFPAFMRPYLNKLISQVGKRTEKALELLRPVLKGRRTEREQKGENHPDKPLDILSWIMDEAKGEEAEEWYLTSRVLAINAGAIHTTSMGFTQALYDLAARQEYVQPLREEVEKVIAREGWTKAALDQMPQVDSFLKESQRLRPMGLNLMGRIAMQDYTFSDGTTIPAGTMIAVYVVDDHTSEEFYENPLEFDGFRFVKKRQNAVSSGQTEKRFDLVTTGLDSLGFGHGRHACPGRYFASSELKLILAHIVMNYDVRTVEEGVRPEDLHIIDNCIPNPTAKLLFRRRQNYLRSH
ncbi:cytochrome P450 [Crepidotus variabilis]|uniref:Cytochrome P450 n=1 Tax=Crepidotus variabilis TaxID=179855 RepID=A0A9P6EG31_9AGAR|nr:cytochrome P450 [Crepidotus variabilis]